MTDKEFWDLVEWINQHRFPYETAKIDFMLICLTRFSPAEIMDFKRILDEKVARAYNSNLWNVLIAIYCECSSYELQAFCAWLALTGKNNYQTVLSDITHLKNLIPADEDVREESYISFPRTSYELLTGKDMPPQKRDPIQVDGHVTPTYKEARAMYPDFASKFENCEDKPYV